MSAKPEPLMTTPEVAEFLHVSEKTLVDWRYKSTGPVFIRFGGKVRYRPADLRAWLQAHEVGAA
jgi:predicted DNA-binding transcriptional regulator AlpA